MVGGVKRRGLKVAPKLAVGDGALGFWKALPQVFGETRRQRCWMHMTANVLDKLPRNIQARAKENLHQFWLIQGIKFVDGIKQEEAA